MVENKKVFSVDINGKTLNLAVTKPSMKEEQQAAMIYAREFHKFVKPEGGGVGALTRQALEDVLKQQGIWNDEKQARYAALSAAIEQGVDKLKAGKIKLREAREIAIQLRRDRWELRQLLSRRNALDENTADAQAANIKFNYLVSVCTRYADTGNPFFKSEDDYFTRASAGEEAANKAAVSFSQLYYGLDEKYEHNLPENKFLLQYKFCREKDLHLIDADGNLIDAEGNRVNEDGDKLDEQGQPIKKTVEFAPFLDDDGNPVAVPEAV